MRVEKEIPIKDIMIDRIPLEPKSFEYAKALEKGNIFPAIKVTKKSNGLFEIRDGRHRWLVHKLIGK